jgi:hypothetical protein
MQKRTGYCKRSASIAQKATNYKGFGQRIPSDSDKTRWYYIEYNYETETDADLIELHWLKVQAPDRPARVILQQIVEVISEGNPMINVVDFLAVMWFAHSMSDPTNVAKSINAGFLFPATKMGDTAIRSPIAGAESLQDCRDPKLLALAFRYCEVERILQGNEVSLLKRK